MIYDFKTQYFEDTPRDCMRKGERVKGSENMTEKYVSPDVKAIKRKRIEIENEICELYKNANLVMASGNCANEDEGKLLLHIQNICLNMLLASNTYR